MKKLKFNAGIGDTLIQTVMAQKMFDEWFKTNIDLAPVVYGYVHKDGWTLTRKTDHQIKARIVLQEPIECKHEPLIRIGAKETAWHQGARSVSNGLIKPDSFECNHCHIELIADWRAKDE